MGNECYADPLQYFRCLFLFCSVWERLILSEAAPLKRPDHHKNKGCLKISTHPGFQMFDKLAETEKEASLQARLEQTEYA